MILNSLLNGVHIKRQLLNNNKNIRGIAYDSRKVETDYIFVCIQGLTTDGHNYIDNAIINGASSIVIDKEIPNIATTAKEKGVNIIKVANSRIALSKISNNFFNNPSGKIKVIGVTGTNGKTSITYLINSILEANKVKCALLGTINNRIGKKVINTDRTTPEAPELNTFFDLMVKNNIEVCTMEVSSHALEMKRVEDIEFNIGIFTNLTPDHLDYHGTMENYKKSKLKLFYKTSDINIINIDDKYGKEIYDEIKNLEVPCITYGIEKNCDIRAHNIRMENSYSDFELVTPKFSCLIRLSIPGLFSIYNLLAAISACYSMGYNANEISNGVNSIMPVKGRFELVENNKGINIIVDYAHTPDALENVLKTIKQFAKRKIIVVFGCGGDRDKSKRPHMGRIASEYSDYCIITNDNPRSEEPEKIIDDIIQGINDKKSSHKVIMDRRKAIEAAIEFSKKDDFVLIAGKGHETYQIIGNKTFDFDDKEIAKEILGRTGK